MKPEYHWEDQLREARKDLLRRFDEGVRNGYFDLRVRGAIGKHGRIEVYVEGGNSTKYTVLDEDIRQAE